MAEPTCRSCGEPLPVTSGAGRPRAYCNEACARAYWRIQRRKPRFDRTCEVCGEDFTTARATQRFCSDFCGHKFHRRKSDQPWNDRRRQNAQLRRARKKGSGTAGPVLLKAIRERDQGRCGICGKAIGTKVWPHPRSASLDHVVPLSVGGTHDPANVQLAHLECNLAKGNRGGGEQLRLHG
jgi:5-methylcytosine-specific restriction endonuclease McrA